MPGKTPQEAFANAQAAIAKQDWDAFFACLDAGDLKRILKNGLSRLGRDERIEALCREAGVEQDLLDRVKALAIQMADAAQATLSGGTEGSLRLKVLVEAHRKALEEVTGAATDPATLAAAVEWAMRAALGGGSVSSSLFVDETLEEVAVEGDLAWGVRRNASGLAEGVGFVQQRGEWQVRLFARPRTRPR